MRSDFKRLRKKIDGSDPFMTEGHQIIKSAGATRHASRVSKVPDWALDNEKVQALLLRSFPNLKTDPVQRARAARWAQVIHLYYRMGWTRAKIMQELQMTIPALDSLLRGIKRASEGKRANGKGSLSDRPAGRPKICARIETAIRDIPVL